MHRSVRNARTRTTMAAADDVADMFSVASSDVSKSNVKKRQQSLDAFEKAGRKQAARKKRPESEVGCMDVFLGTKAAQVAE